MMKALSPEERHEHLPSLFEKGWQMSEGRDALEKEFVFKDFTQAFAWMTAVALCAEKMDHHPEWQNIYRRVEVVLISHDCNALSQRDLDLAQKMDALASRFAT